MKIASWQKIERIYHQACDGWGWKLRTSEYVNEGWWGQWIEIDEVLQKCKKGVCNEV